MLITLKKTRCIEDEKSLSKVGYMSVASDHAYLYSEA